MVEKRINRFIKDQKRKIKWMVLLIILMMAAGIYLKSSIGSEIELQQEFLGAENEYEAALQAMQTAQEVAESLQEEISANLIYVDVSGAVRSPGVVALYAGARVYSALEAAGGVTAEADLRYINQASECEDGQKIYVPTTAECEAGEGNLQGTGGTVSTGTGTGTVISWPLDQSTYGSGDASSSGLVNINRSSVDELQALKGIGPSMASRIVEYREQHGGFSSIEEIKNVRGIGEKTFENFRDNICV